MATETAVQRALREARERDTNGGNTPVAPTVTTADTATLRETSKSGSCSDLMA